MVKTDNLKKMHDDTIDNGKDLGDAYVQHENDYDDDELGIRMVEFSKSAKSANSSTKRPYLMSCKIHTKSKP